MTTLMNTRYFNTALAYADREMGWADAKAVGILHDNEVDGVALVLVDAGPENEFALLVQPEADGTLVVSTEAEADDFYRNGGRRREF